MYSEDLFHGTSAAKAKQIFLEKDIQPSLGDRHWLGDGVYFFCEPFYAYWWNFTKYFKRYHNHPSRSQYCNRYAIIMTHVTCSKSRVFDLTVEEFFDDFRKTADFLANDPNYASALMPKDLNDGLILNFMFNKMGFSDSFDLVIYVFYGPSQDCRSEYPRRITRRPERQVCVKNKEVIKEITSYDVLPIYEEFDSKIRSLYSTKPTGQKYYRK